MRKDQVILPVLVVVALAAWAWNLSLLQRHWDDSRRTEFVPEPLVVPDFELETQIRTVEDVQRLRAQLILDVFGGPLPQGQKLVRASILVADKPTTSLAIYHGGHEERAENAFGAAALRQAGHDVLAISMPLGDHSRFAEEKNPLRPFLEPVALGLNYALALKEYDEIIMAGLSGGGWTTVLYAAMDTRIERSYSIAGSLPDYLRRVVPNSIGDFEYNLPGLSLGYLDLYLMAASEGREQFQVLIRHDPCCFSGDLAHTYRPFVERRSAELGGQFGLVVDESSKHGVSPTMARLLWGWRSDAVGGR